MLQISRALRRNSCEGSETKPKLELKNRTRKLINCIIKLNKIGKETNQMYTSNWFNSCLILYIS